MTKLGDHNHPQSWLAWCNCSAQCPQGQRWIKMQSFHRDTDRTKANESRTNRHAESVPFFPSWDPASMQVPARGDGCMKPTLGAALLPIASSPLALAPTSRTTRDRERGWTGRRLWTLRFCSLGQHSAMMPAGGLGGLGGQAGLLLPFSLSVFPSSPL